MINDNCDVKGCNERAIYECERLEDNEPIGDYVFVCEDCYDEDKDNLEIVRDTPNEFETHIWNKDKEYDSEELIKEFKHYLALMYETGWNEGRKMKEYDTIICKTKIEAVIDLLEDKIKEVKND